jgi:hypothetical protein
MVFSNVPGPGTDIYLCGEKVVGMQVRERVEGEAALPL